MSLMPRRPLSALPARLGRFFFAAAFALALAGCRSNQAPRDSSAKPKLPESSPAASTFSSPRDDLDRPVKLKFPARRVLVIGPGAVETIFALGAGDRIVGRDSGADFPPDIKKVAIVADFNGPFIEACIAQRPDLVLAQGETWNRERIESWQKKIGAPVAALAPTTVTMVQQDADKIAAWLGVPARDLKLGSPLRDARQTPQPTAFVEIGRSPLWTAGQNTLVSDVVARAGFRNVARDVAGYKAFSKEALLQRQPDFYIATGEPKDRARIVSDLKRDAALSGLKCVREGQVLVVPGSFLLRPGPRLQDGIKQIMAAHQAEARSAEVTP